MRGSSATPGNLETVARATDRLEITGALGIGLNLLTDAPHIDIHRPGGHEAGIPPHGVEQVVAAEDAAGMPGKIVQQPEFGCGGGGQFPAHLQLHGAGVDDHLFEGR